MNNERLNHVFLFLAISVLMIFVIVSILFVITDPGPSTALGAIQSINTINSSNVNIINNKTSKFLVYDNPIIGISMQYPSNWEKVEVSFAGGVIIGFISHLENASDKFLESITVSIDDIPTSIATLPKYKELINKLLNSSSRDLNVTESEPAYLGNMPANKIGFTTKSVFIDKSLNMMQLNVRSMQIYTVNNNKAYIITYTAEIPKYDRYLPIVEKMINSFEITNLTTTVSNMTGGNEATTMSGNMTGDMTGGNETTTMSGNITGNITGAPNTGNMTVGQTSGNLTSS